MQDRRTVPWQSASVMTPMSVLHFRRAISEPVADSGSGGGFTIRPLEPEADRADAVAVVAALAEAAVPLRPAGVLADLQSRPGRSVRAWIAESTAAGDALGFASLVTVGREPRWSIGWLLVRPDARLRGIGRALVTRALHDARAAGAREVWVETGARWPEAIAFWRAVGFGPV